jgi:hypothetical protein
MFGNEQVVDDRETTTSSTLEIRSLAENSSIWHVLVLRTTRLDKASHVEKHVQGNASTKGKPLDNLIHSILGSSSSPHVAKETRQNFRRRAIALMNNNRCARKHRRPSQLMTPDRSYQPRPLQSTVSPLSECFYHLPAH